MERLINCPHCGELVLIQELNCRIFRHGILKETGDQMNPHSPKDVCDELFKNGKIYGCGKPFIIEVLSNGTWSVEKCGYI